MVKYKNILFYATFSYITSNEVKYDKLDIDYVLIPCDGKDDIELIFDLQEIEAKIVSNLLSKYLERK